MSIRTDGDISDLVSGNVLLLSSRRVIGVGFGNNK